MNSEENEKQWGKAIYEWQAGREQKLLEKISELDLPEFCLEFLQDLALEKAMRHQGRPPSLSGETKRKLVFAVFELADSYGKDKQIDRPMGRAIGDVAAAYSNRPAGKKAKSTLALGKALEREIPTIEGERRFVTTSGLRGIVAELTKVGITLEYWKERIRERA